MTAVDPLVEATATVARLVPVWVVESDTIGAYAIELVTAGWAVLPLRGKLPATDHGVLDATTDLDTVVGWWSGRHRRANIGARIPEGLLLLDVDPRNGGRESLRALTGAHGPLPPTLTVASGRGDGGRHYSYRRPVGKLSAARLGPGLDLKTSGYAVMPPSLHPATGKPYVWLDLRDPVPCPRWLAELLRPAPAPEPRRVPGPRAPLSGSSVADAYSASTRWVDVLGRHGWRCVAGDGDGDGSAWRHPTAISPVSATVKHGTLFVYSTTPGLPVTQPGEPHGLTRFRAFAYLEHGGDLAAAARSLRKAATG